MVVINIENFLQELPGIIEAMKNCSFVAFDLEMTGIFGQERNRKDDDVEERYLKMVPTATKYSIIQIGLCFFSQADEEAEFVATPYSFFVFPEWGPDLIVSPGSMTFLKKNNMDFNSWIYKGLNFCNESTSLKVREQKAQRELASLITPGSDGELPPTLMPNRPAEIEQMNALKSSINEWAASNTSQEYVVPACNAFLRRCIYNFLEFIYPQLRTRKDDSKPNEIIIIKVTEEQRKVMAIEEENKFKLKLGFRLVWEELQKAQKPLCGHNCFYDLLFMFRWLDGPLPPTFPDFKERCVSLFPGGFYDTKFVASSGMIPNFDAQNDDTALQPLYDSVTRSASPGIVRFASPSMEYSGASAQAHDAGYDAYMTGAIFASVCSAATASKTTAGATATATVPTGGLDAVKSKCWSRLFLMQSLYSFSLSPQHPQQHSFLRVNHGDIYLVSGFDSSEVKTSDIEALFLPSASSALTLDAQKGSSSDSSDSSKAEAEAATATATATATLTMESTPQKSALLETIWIDGSSAWIIVERGQQVPTTTLLPEGWSITPLADFEKDRHDKRIATLESQLKEQCVEPDLKRPKL